VTLTPPHRTIRALTRLAHRLGRMPTLDDFAARPLAQRAAEQPPRWSLLAAPAGVETEDLAVPARDGKVPIRVYRPAGLSGRGLLYLHGGGFMAGGFGACHHILLDLASRTGDVVVSVEYRLAPDHPFPAGLDDCEDALDWYLAQAPQMGVDPARIAAGGDSAGGNLAAALCLRRRDAGRAQPAKQVIIYPMLDLTCARESWVSEAAPPLTRTGAAQVMLSYADGRDVTSPELSPLFAEDLGGLPPALVVTAQHDTLRDDGNEYAAKLRDAGTPVRLVEYPGMPHGFLSLPRLNPKQYDACLLAVVDHLTS